MTADGHPAAHSAAAIAMGVMKKAALLTVIGTIAAAALQMTAWPGMAPWPVPAGVLFGGLIGVVNFRWLAYAIERVYLRKGASSLLANVAAAVVNVLKLSAIFIVLFIVIKNHLVHIVGLVAGLTCCFVAILWQGFDLMTELKEDRK
jgi:hypothetical protein